MTPPRPASLPPIIVIWILWFALLIGFLIIYSVLKPSESGNLPPSGFMNWIGLGPILVGVTTRLIAFPLLAPKVRSILPMFIVGLSMVESGGLLGILFGGPNRDTIVAITVIAYLTYLPAFLPKKS